MTPASPIAEHALNGPEGCRLWLLDLRQPIDARDWLACGEEEQTRASRFRFERDAMRYRAAHAHMRRVLARELGTSPEALRWRRGAHGKPHLTGHEGWHVNLSHSEDWALLGMSQGRRIGVDIECHKPSLDIDLMARHNFGADDLAVLAQCPPEEREACFYRIWVCKEACLKALGCGLMLEPRHIEAAWGMAWTTARAQVADRSFALMVHGIDLPASGMAGVAGPGIQAAVALMPRQDHDDHDDQGEGPNRDW